MTSLETRIQQAESKVGQLQTVLDKTQEELQNAEVVVHIVERIPKSTCKRLMQRQCP